MKTVTRGLARIYRVDFSALVNRVADKQKRSFFDLRDQQVSVLKDMELQFASAMGDLLYNDLTRNAARVNTWADLIVAGEVTFDDLYVKQHTVDTEVLWINEKRIIAYHLLGIPRGQWLDWEKSDVFIHHPHMMRRYNDLAAKLRPDNLVPTWAEELDVSLDMNSRYSRSRFTQEYSCVTYPLPSVTQFREWLIFLNELERIGVKLQPDTGLADWYVQGWLPSAAARFLEHGIKIRDVARVEKAGVQGSDLIVRVLTGGMPIEWAITASKARVAIN